MNSILVVDDNAISLETSCLMFAHYGLTPDTAVSGTEALNLCRAKHYHLIFMDLVMPGFSGFETAKCILHHYRLHSEEELPVIAALSAENRTEIIEACRNAGMTDFLSKPLCPDAIEKILKKYLPDFCLPSDLEQKKENLPFPQIPGIDRAIAKTFSLGDLSSFHNLLYSYYLHGKALYPSLQSNFESSRFRNLLIDIHGLKGSSASIGAQSLSAHAKSLETVLKAENSASLYDTFHDFLAEYRALLTNISSYLSSLSPVPDTQILLKDLILDMQQLNRHILLYELSKADAILDRLVHSYCTDCACLPSVVKQISEHLRLCRYKEAAGTCSNFLRIHQ